jgi:iron(III) transport system permease protein
MTAAPEGRRVPALALLCVAAFGLLPWYLLQDGFWGFGWLAGYPREAESAPALSLLLQGRNPWLWPLGLLALAALAAAFAPMSRQRRGQCFLGIGAAGLAYLLLQGYALGLQGWSFGFLGAWFGDTEQRQFGMGYGALLCGAAFLFMLTWGLSASGRVAQDPFVAGALGVVIALVAMFVLLPVLQMLFAGLRSDEGSALAAFADRLVDPKIWRLGCLDGKGQCGAAWNSLALAVTVGFLSTLLGLAFALVIVRTSLPFKRVFKSLSLLPIITPPFVIGLAVILLLGLSGVVTQWVAATFGIAPSRWIYGFEGVLLAQLLAFTPISFMVLIGVVEGVSPSMEEASQTLRANDWVTFKTVTWPLLRPGLANAFLLGFIESMADFANPLVLGGNFNVLSTEIFFAIVGSQNDQARASVLALVLLAFTVAAFAAQNLWLGRRRYTTVSGKGEGGMHPPLPRPLLWGAVAVTVVWTVFTLVLYGLIIFGSFVELWGRNWSLTTKHYLQGFAIAFTEHGLQWRGSAWSSLGTTLQIALISAPLTAAIGLLTAWLLTRQQFAGKSAFEFGTMLSFAIPGTVIGVSYIVAFNVPPIELTGTAAILVLCFVFRNMPVGVRSGIASLSQIDKSLDEASLTLRASSATTFFRITLPLIRPALLSALVYSFVRSMTAISAVIFLVSARHDMATTYIIGRVENNEYGIAIAYSTVLIVVMLSGIVLFQWLAGTRRLGRHGLRPNETPVIAGAA